MPFEQIQEAVRFIRKQTDFIPRYGIILGTGLDGLARAIEPVVEFAYDRIPFFPISTVKGHQGKLIFGHLQGMPVVAMAGRFHLYEGYALEQVVFPVRVLKFLGIRRLVISNASGSVNPAFEKGDIVFIRDHINLQPGNPLRGLNDERLGPRFPDMLHAYDPVLNDRAMELASAHGLRAHQGVYAALPGPNFETPAEYAFLHRIGADLAGMSTVPEVLAARHLGLPVFVLSVVTDKCYPLSAIRPTTHEEVLEVARVAEPGMRLIVTTLLQELDAGEVEN